MTLKLNSAAIVSTAEGVEKQFTDWLSKTVVSHPKASTAVVFVLGCVIGHLVRF